MQFGMQVKYRLIPSNTVERKVEKAARPMKYFSFRAKPGRGEEKGRDANLA